MNKTKNVKPIKGQVWDCDVIGGISKRTIREVIYNSPYHHDVFFECANHMKTNDLWECGTFIPQTNLEWLACKVELGDNVNFITRNGSGYNIWKDTPNLDNYHFPPRVYTKQQLQDKQFELGLSNTNIVGLNDLIRDNSYYRDEAKKEEQKKETTMIDLSTAKVGDKFDWSGDNMEGVKLNGLAKLEYITPNGFYVFYCGSEHSGILIVVDEYGMGVYTGKQQSFTKHEPRHWLKDLPDASYFELFNIDYIHCSRGYKWLATGPGATGCARSLVLNQGEMPTLTDDQRRDSKISIVDLKAWQEANK